MAITEYKKFCAFCALCGQPVETKGFTLTTREAQQHFCCAGCLSIYQLLNEKRNITNPNPPQLLQNEVIKTMKACDSCSGRVEIGKNHKQIPVWQRGIGMTLIYLPLLTFPFVFISAYLTYFHLRMVGGKNIKTLSDFIPDRASHRYNLKSQITMEGSFKASMAQSKLFWILNCTWYCPVSVALFEWHAYMVKIVENWWCPFTHEKKESYNNAMIDKSFWHLYPQDISKLEKEDRDNPIWNESADKLS